MDYKLSQAARTSIAEIVEYTDVYFDTAQTDAYVAGLASSFELLTRFPDIGVTSYEIKQGLRKYRYQKHQSTTLIKPASSS